MKLAHRTTLAALLVGAMLGLALSGVITMSSGRTASGLVHSGGCPSQVKPGAIFGPAQAIVVMRALKAQVPRVYANLTSMGEPAWPHFQVTAIVRLDQLPLGGGFLPAVRGLGRYKTLAVRACGRTTALASVLVFLDFPYCQLPCSFSWAYVTPTRTGWHLWTSYKV